MMTNQQVPLEQIKAVKQAHQDRLMGYPNVVGVAIGRRQVGGKPTHELALIVMVTQKLALDKLAPEDVLPKQIEGVPIDIHQVGEIRANS
jgi:hypothetical protein